MKILTISIAFSILFLGCSSPYLATNFKMNEDRSTTVGGKILEVVKGDKTTGGSIINTFTRALIYGGIDGPTIQIMYREYYQDVARPAFSQELKYDLSKNKIITYEDYRIQIIDASTERITYRVLSAPDDIVSSIDKAAKEKKAEDARKRGWGN